MGISTAITLVPVLLSALVYYLGSIDASLPGAWAPYTIKNIHPSELPNVERTKELAGVLAPNTLLRNAIKLENVSSSESVALCPSTGHLALLNKFGYLYFAKPTTAVQGDAPYELDPQPAAYVGPGRPLGFTCTPDNRIIICNSLKGLMSYDLNTRTLTVLANWVSRSSRIDPGTPITYANDLDIAADGTIYFTSSQEIPVQLSREGYYDTLKSYLMGLYSGSATGKLLRYDPVTGETVVLYKGLRYANGVALAADESFAAIVETNRQRVMRYWLKGPKAGKLDVLVDMLPGVPDNISRAPDGGFWVCLLTPLPPLFKLLKFKGLRTVMAYMPDWARPRLPMWGVALKLKPDGEPAGLLMDPDGSHVAYISSAHQHGDMLYLGNLRQNYVSTLDLAKLDVKL